MAAVFNLLIFFCTVFCTLTCFRREGMWDVQQGRKALRFFTLLSNIFSALASLLPALLILAGNVPVWAWILHYIATASVTVTLVTVMVYLGPAAGYKAMLSGRDMYFHLIGPLLAVNSFCFFERWYPMTFPLALTGMLPVIIYGAVYLRKVVFCPEERRWDDFYGYNRNGRWAMSFAAMLMEAFLICLLLWGLCRIG